MCRVGQPKTKQRQRKAARRPEEHAEATRQTARKADDASRGQGSRAARDSEAVWKAARHGDRDRAEVVPDGDQGVVPEELEVICKHSDVAEHVWGLYTLLSEKYQRRPVYQRTVPNRSGGFTMPFY